MQGHPVRNEPELGVDCELHPNTRCNLKQAVNQTHTQWCAASGLTDSGEPMAKFLGILSVGCRTHALINIKLYKIMIK